jgi:hypothetical protein
MPKERVYGHPVPAMPGDEEIPEETPVAEVRWGRGMDVCLVTRAEEYEVLTDERDPTAVKHGYYVYLDRNAINGLIRHLRRARDQAFGRDE